MVKKQNAIESALEGKVLLARTKAELETDLDETIQWAETEDRALPIRVKRGRPAANEPPRETRSVTVRFPLAAARQLEAAAKRSGASLSEFVRAAAAFTAEQGLPLQVTAPNGQTAFVTIGGPR